MILAVHRQEECFMSQSKTPSPSQASKGSPRTSKGSATPPGPDPKAAREREAETVSKPGGFKNDPDDPTNPNEAIERSRRALRERSSGGG
jgi:hypothetical protein